MKKSRCLQWLAGSLPTAVLIAISQIGLGAVPEPPLNISNQLQLFVDQKLIARLDGVQLRLHSPERREVVF